MKTSSLSLVISLAAGLASSVTPAHAAVYLVSEASLSSPVVNPATIVTFDEIPVSTPIHGQTIKGFTFSENIPGAITDTGGPGATAHVFPPFALSGGAYNPLTYALTIDMPTLSDSFGLGFAILDSVPTANALTITLFNGLTNLGSLTYGAVPDPDFDGGFAGIGSTVGFTSARINFGPTAGAFALDNIAATAVPEPTSWALLGFGLVALGAARRRH